MPISGPERWKQFSAGFDHALEMSDRERGEWLAALSDTDPELAREITEALQQRQRPGYAAFLAEPLLTADEAPATASLTGRKVGAYVIESELGRGGMGSVWRARRIDDRFESTVAVKFLHASWIGLEGAERFRAEGQLLGRLDHPNIARLIDAGVLDGAEPYLVIEYVEGEPIDAYCDRNALDVRSRVTLFLDVLAAVAHAHNHLIIHRDIKPANIFVTRGGSVKLLDFGIAKLLRDPAGAAAATQSRATALTPQYAAPEQLLGQPITTATDVYSLGLVLYLLLAGKHPFEAASGGYADLLRAQLTDETPRASRVAGSAAATRKLLDGDLDNILAKSMKKPPVERYGNVAAFADDLRRYLNHEPVRARPDTVSYRTAKFVRRHRGGVLSGVLTALVLCVATVTTFLQKLEADRQRDSAQFEARRAEASNEFLNVLLMSGDAGRASSPAERLALGARMLELQYRDDPRFAGRMLLQLASQYQGDTDTRSALDLDTRALELGRSAGDRELIALALCAAADSDASSGVAADGSRRIADARRVIAQIGNPSVELRIACDRAEALSDVQAGKPAAAEQTLLDARRLLEESGKTYLAAYTTVLNDLGSIYNDKARYPQALEMTHLIGATHERFGRGGTTARLMALQNEAAVLVNIGEMQAALAASDEVRSRRRAIEGDAAEPLSMLVNSAKILVSLDRIPEALELARTAAERARVSGNELWRILALRTLCQAYLFSAQLPQAEAAIAEIKSVLDSGSAGDSHFAGIPYRLRALYELQSGESAAALQSAMAALAITGAPANGESGEARAALEAASRASLLLGNPPDAEKFARQALGMAEAIARGPDTSADVGEALLLVAKAQLARGQTQDTHSELERAVRSLTNGLGAAHPLTQEALKLTRSPITG
jgi:serine/threonine-protein kinase